MVLDGQGEDAGDLVVAARAHHDVGGVGQVAGAGAQQVGGRLAPGAQASRVVVDVHVVGADHVAQRGQHAVAEPHRGQLDVGRGGRLVQAEGELDQPAGGLGQRGRGARVAPALRVHLARVRTGGRGAVGNSGVVGHVLQCDT